LAGSRRKGGLLRDAQEALVVMTGEALNVQEIAQQPQMGCSVREMVKIDWVQCAPGPHGGADKVHLRARQQAMKTLGICVELIRPVSSWTAVVRIVGCPISCIPVQSGDRDHRFVHDVPPVVVVMPVGRPSGAPTQYRVSASVLSRDPRVWIPAFGHYRSARIPRGLLNLQAARRQK
jgi:hypothetical protein